MSNAYVANTTEIENHVPNRFVGQAVGVVRLAAVQGINSQVNNRVYMLRAAADKGVAGVVATRFGGLDAELRDHAGKTACSTTGRS